MTVPSHIVAGQHGGIKVGLSPALKPVYDSLKQMGHSGNHWARVATQEIDSLTSGHMKSNVFIGQSCNLLNNFVFTLILPGCKASVRKKSNGEYYIYHLEMDVHYQNLVNKRKKPGLFESKMAEGDLSVAARPNGEIKNTDGRIVVVSDGHPTPEDAAAQALNHTVTSPFGEYTVSRSGFDFQYHYGARIGGLKQIGAARNPQSDPGLRENALMLATTMESALKTPGVAWLTERGGAGVFTHALGILKERGVKFSKSGHHVFFSHPTTSLLKAESLARELGLKFTRSTHTSDKLNVDELVGGLNVAGDIICAYQRFRADESYSAVKMSVDMAKGSGASWKAVSTLAVSTAAVSAAVGLGGGAVAMPATIAVATAVGGLGKTLFKAWLPVRYRSIVSKL